MNWTRRKARSRGKKKWRSLAIAGEEEEGSRKCGSEEIELKKKKVEGVENLRSSFGKKRGGDLNLNGGDLGRREKRTAGIEGQIW